MSQILDEALNDLKLNEAFSNSMPQWMKDRMIFSVPGSWQEKVKKHPNVRNLKYPDYSNRYAGPQNLFNILTNFGYNLSKMEFTNVEIPNSINDELFENPDALTFVHYVSDSDDKIWVPGINDEERFLGDDGRYHKFGSFNNANFKKYAKDIVQSDLNAETTHLTDYTMNKDKKLNALYNGKPINYNWETEYDSTTGSKFIRDKNILNRRAVKGDVINSEFFDKSGYFRGSKEGELSNRLKTELKKIKNKKTPNLVFKAEEDIKNLNDMISAYVQSQLKKISIDDYDDYATSVSNILFEYKQLIPNFNRLKMFLMDDIERLKTNPDGDFSDSTVTRLKIVNDEINKIKNICSGYEQTSLVW